MLLHSDSSVGLLFSLLPPHTFLQKGERNGKVPIKEKVSACVASNEPNSLCQVRVKLLLEVLWRYCQGHLVLLCSLHFAPEQHVRWGWEGEQRQQAEQPERQQGLEITRHASPQQEHLQSDWWVVSLNL